MLSCHINSEQMVKTLFLSDATESSRIEIGQTSVHKYLLIILLLGVKIKLNQIKICSFSVSAKVDNVAVRR